MIKSGISVVVKLISLVYIWAKVDIELNALTKYYTFVYVWSYTRIVDISYWKKDLNLLMTCWALEKIVFFEKLSSSL